MEIFRNHSRIKKAIILAGGQKTRLYPLDHSFAPCILPVLNRPLITYTVDFLKKNGIEEIMLSVSEHNEIYDHIKNEYSPEIKIDFHIEDTPRGTAGALKELEAFIGQDIFLVINGSVLIEDIDLNKALDHFLEMGSAALVVVYKISHADDYLESVKITNGDIDCIYINHASTDRRSPWRSAGMYLFDPAVLQFIDQNVYMDLKEQLLPALKRESLPVSAYQIEGCYKSVGSAADYFMLQRDILINLHNRTNYWPIGSKTEIADRVWAGKNVFISPKAYLLGPVVIGDDCMVGDWAQVIGPAVIGNGCKIAPGVIFRESILHDNVSLTKNSKISYSVIFEDSEVPGDVDITSMLVSNGFGTISANLIPIDYSIKDLLALSSLTSITRINHSVYRAVKRFLDLIFSAAGFVLLLPVFLIIAFAIKKDSAGPVFYRQKRCGKDGRFFKMIKFRTMVKDAEKLQQDLLPDSDTDGPMFKMFNDPRITKIGRFLRKTSLDEIPQLLNVLKGEMSLVGPRPLIMDEMKFSSSWRDIRLKVKPGITGLWQIEGRREASFHDWIKYDVYYVKNQSFLLDLYILLKTVIVVLRRVGAY